VLSIQSSLSNRKVKVDEYINRILPNNILKNTEEIISDFVLKEITYYEYKKIAVLEIGAKFGEYGMMNRNHKRYVCIS